MGLDWAPALNPKINLTLGPWVFRNAQLSRLAAKVPAREARKAKRRGLQAIRLGFWGNAGALLIRIGF